MTLPTLTETLLRHAIGYDPLLRYTPQSHNFPYHNIEQTGEDTYRLTMALAGYSREDVDVWLDRGILTVVGKKPDEKEDAQYLHRGIAYRDFVREFKLGEFVEVAAASMEHGLLIVDLERRVPESARRVSIPIN